MMNARNIEAEKKYAELRTEAQQITANLIKAINLELGQNTDEALLKMLVENWNRAKQIGMRGEIIDIAELLKKLCTLLLQEMMTQTPTSEEENEIDSQMYILREEDKRSVFDAKYDEFISYRTLE
jgi:5,10-methylene-tetrahydrofolate dehydrogenase/methenyl tetrahydrofolate cyclohydrolase